MELTKEKSIGAIIVNGIFLIVLNLALMFIIGYLTLDSGANLNSRVGASLLSFFLPMFIVYKTKNMDGMERMLKFGFGFIAYIVLSLLIVGFPQAFVTWLIPCLIVALATLFYGKEILRTIE